MSTKDRLSALAGEIAKLKTEIAILAEQLEFVQDVAEDARIRAVVSETPIADREAREAREDAERHRRSLEEAKEQLARMQQEQDALLERLFDESR